MYKIESFNDPSENHRRLLLEDLIGIESKKVESEKLLEVSLADYKCKKRLYVEAKDSFEEILLVKRKIKD